MAYIPSSTGPVDPRSSAPTETTIPGRDDTAGASGCAPAVPPRLFDIPELEQADEGLSIGARRTRRWRAMLEAGTHPATRRPVATPIGLHTCGTCHHHVIASANRTYHKCALHVLGTSSSEASDIRVRWPACELYRECEP